MSANKESIWPIFKVSEFLLIDTLLTSFSVQAVNASIAMIEISKLILIVDLLKLFVNEAYFVEPILVT